MKSGFNMKKLYKLFFLLLFLSLELFSQTTINYQGTDEIFLNPERGFSGYRSNPITLSYINTLKASKISVIQRIYTIPQYNSTALPEVFLNAVQNDLNTARQGGMKVVLRFSYTNNQNGKDAALDTILLHINQLTPVLQNNYDVIAYVEAGFIGAWGEWYYSSHNLNNTASRRTVLYALLDALPVKRNVVIRTPDYKRKIFQINEPLDSAEAFSGSKRARTGAHNDCFLADETDMGTYLYNNIEGDKNYLNLDNRFVPQGGETCCDCGFAGCNNALQDLARMRWSVLNKDYHPDVLNRWVNEGCMDEIKRRLGYRFELIQATISDSIKPGGIFDFSLQLTNKGFASPYNPRNFELILRNNSDHKRYRLLTDKDPRFWQGGDTINVNITAGIPANMPAGNYSVFLFLADPEQQLHDNPSYAIRVANENVWEDSTGYNFLNHSININSNNSGANYAGTDYFELYDGLTDIIDEQPIQPQEYKINVYPNPFNGYSTIQFNINPRDINSAQIFDINGKLIKDFLYPEYSSGKIIWDATDNNSNALSSGVYFVTIKTMENMISEKIIFLK